MNDTYPQDYANAVAVARDLLFDEALVILDTETTGLDGEAEIVEIAIIDRTGSVILNQRIRPHAPIPAAASAIHGIIDADVEKCPTFDQVLPEITRVLEGKTVCIYNAAYDIRLIMQSMVAAGAHDPPLYMATCAMELYATWTGDWNDYHQSYKWQRLPAGDHSALGDCKATLEVLKRMAAS